MIDVKNFKHPGPQKLVTSHIGEDMTDAFTSQMHSAAARDLCSTMTVGYVGKKPDQKGQLMQNFYDTLTAEEEEIHRKLDSMIDISKPLLPQVE